MPACGGEPQAVLPLDYRGTTFPAMPWEVFNGIGRAASVRGVILRSRAWELASPSAASLASVQNHPAACSPVRYHKLAAQRY